MIGVVPPGVPGMDESILGSVGSPSGGFRQYPGASPFGLIAPSAVVFDAVRISSSAPHFAIDNVVVTLAAPTAAPEPATVALTASGLLLVAGVAARGRGRARTR